LKSCLHEKWLIVHWFGELKKEPISVINVWFRGLFKIGLNVKKRKTYDLMKKKAFRKNPHDRKFCKLTTGRRQVHGIPYCQKGKKNPKKASSGFGNMNTIFLQVWKRKWINLIALARDFSPYRGNETTN